jgi:O-antigen/teichoic acid export membrane protein
MNRKGIRRPKRSKLRRFLIYLVLLLALLGLFARPLAKGALFYQSYWGGAIFIPFLLLIVAIFVVAVVVNSNRNKNP